MKFAADFRYIAREALRGKWLLAILVGVVAGVLGGGNGPTVNFHFDGGKASASLDMAGQTILSTAGGFGHHMRGWLIGGAIYILVVILVFGTLYFVLGSVIEVGYARFNLKLVDRQNAEFGDLFSPFLIWKSAAVARILRSLFTMLWSLLFLIPGIIASFGYAMTPYILAEYPELSASEAIARSKRMMAGNKLRLFCLEFSFIGWGILAALTMGIGGLWLTPYTNAAKAAFYRDVSRNTVEF